MKEFSNVCLFEKHLNISVVKRYEYEVKNVKNIDSKLRIRNEKIIKKNSKCHLTLLKYIKVSYNQIPWQLSDSIHVDNIKQIDDIKR